MKTLLRFDRHEQRFLLLFPERGLLLNDAASAILQLCTGELTIQAIVNLLSSRYPASPHDVIENDVIAFMTKLQSRGLIEV